MIYLDYSATTKASEKVLKRFNDIALNNFANANSRYDIAYDSKKVIDEATNNILSYFKVPLWNIIYTSGASEANNTIIKGICDKYNSKRIITTKLEHSSIITPLGYLQRKGFKISFVNLDENGIVDINHLKSLLDEDVVLVTIGYVSSELGIEQPINEIGKIIHEYNSNIIFHTDMTQAVGKIIVDLTNVDCASFSGHKIHTFKGIGALLMRNDIKITPLIHGGKSTSVYRSGTPQTELIDSLSTAISEINLDLNYVFNLRSKLIKGLEMYSGIKINSSVKSIPHIVNFSILGLKSDITQKYFAKKGIYISTKTACSSESEKSLAVYELTHDEERSESSVRVSLALDTKMDEIDNFLKVLEGLCNEYKIN